MKKTGYYVLLLLGIGVVGYFTTQGVLSVMSGAKDKREALQSIGCSATNAGTLRYSNGCFQYCDGKGAWINKGAGCDASSHTISCIGLPVANASWNTTSSITQTRNGDEWLPTAIGSYNTTASDNECRFTCNENYTYSGGDNTCMANTKSNQSCTGLVANAEWNTALSITQTWNGSGRVPITIGSYSTTGSTTECRFKCKENYTYNGGNNTCVANTKTGQLCTSLVANAEWNTVSSITQTWDGSTRTPTTTGSYNITGSTAECRFKCKDGYAWDGATSTCATTCENGAIGIVGTAGHVRNPSNGTITITDGTCGFIIQDKNVGATTVGIGSSSAEIGNYYQWGNRCGRSSAAAPSLTTTTLVTSISENSTYPSSCSGVPFVEASVGYPYWLNVSILTNASVGNLWGDITDRPLGTNRAARRGPCPVGYHVPSIYEWQQLLTIGGNLNLWGIFGGTNSSYGNGNSQSFRDKLKLPIAGCFDGRFSGGSSLGSPGQCVGSIQGVFAVGTYRSSTAIFDNNAYRTPTALSIHDDNLGVYAHTSTNTAVVGNIIAFPVRCFKDAP